MHERGPSFRRPRRPRGPHRVLVVRLSAIGDVLHALPAIHAWKRARPDVEFEWLVEDRAASVLAGHPSIARLHVVPRGRWRALRRSVGGRVRGWAEAARFAAGLLRRRFDLVVDLQGNGKSGLWSLLAGAPVRAGLATGATREGNAFVTNRRVSVPATTVHRVERALGVASRLAEVELTYSGTGLDAVRGDDAAARAEAFSTAALAERGLGARTFAILHPGTSGFGSFKRWPPERFAALADLVTTTSAAGVLITGGPGEEALVDAVRARARGAVATMITPDLASLAAVARRARVFVAADTGPVHLAAAVGTPVLALFGPKDAAVYGPYGWRADGTAGPLPVVVRDDVPCRPCTVRWCPEPVCMSAIDEREVLARVAPWLA